MLDVAIEAWIFDVHETGMFAHVNIIPFSEFLSGLFEKAVYEYPTTSFSNLE